MFHKKNYNGITPKTVENLQLDAGAIFKNIVVGTDTYASAKANGKLIGITEGGSEFKAVVSVRQITADGATSRVVGLADTESWEVSLKTTFKEMTTDNLKLALAAASSTSSNGFDVIVGKNAIESSDYITNLTWVGCITGTTAPIYIQIYNGLNEDGLTLTPQDKAEGKCTCTFYGYNTLEAFADDEVEPPFKIYRPNANAGLQPCAATYDDNTDGENNRNIAVTLTASTLSSIKNGNTTLTSGTDYTVSGHRIVILRSYLTTLTGTSATLTFNTADSANPTLAIALTDTSI